MKHVEFLKVGSYAVLDHFLKHITELVQVGLTKDTTLSDVAQDLKKQCARSEDACTAIDSWADSQDQDILPKTVYELFEIDEEDEYAYYISFNIWNSEKTD